MEADEVMARFEAVTLEDLRELTDELWAPERLSGAGIGPDEAPSGRRCQRSARAPAWRHDPRRGRGRRRGGMIRVAVAGAGVAA